MPASQEVYIDRPPKIRSVSVDRNYGRPFEIEEFKALPEAARDGPPYNTPGFSDQWIR